MSYAFTNDGRIGLRKIKGVKILTGSTEECLADNLRKFRLDSLIEFASKESRLLLCNTDNINEHMGMRSINVPVLQGRMNGIAKHDVRITGWDLIDLIYYAVLFSNDYRGVVMQHDYELAGLLSVLGSYREEKEKNQLREISAVNSEFILYLYGFGGEQFKFQGAVNPINHAVRDLFILHNYLPASGELSIDNIIEEELGVGWETVVASLYLALIQSTRSSDPFDVEDYICWDDEFSRYDYHRVIDRYTVSYEDIKESKLGRQILYGRPFVKTKKGKTIISNAFLTFFLYEHSIYWICRDVYYKKRDQQFVSCFGVLFEKYFAGVLSDCLNVEEYKKITEGKNKAADWEINILENCFLIEQKSSLIHLSAKQQSTDVEKTKLFAIKTVFEALQQLQSSEELKGQPCIKIILLYEDYLLTESLYSFMNLDGCPIENDGTYWMVTINEMETLLDLYKNDREKCQKIIDEKIRREKSDRSSALNLGHIMYEYGIKHNRYLDGSKFNYYRWRAPDIVKKHIMK